MQNKPSMMTRARVALKVFREGFPRRRYESKAGVPFIWPLWRQGQAQWQIIDLETYVNEGFNLNSLIYSAIMYKVRAMTAAPLRAYEGDRDEPEPLGEDHPLAKLVARPNMHQSWEEFHGLNIAYINLSGNCYVWMRDRESETGLPEQMFPMRPDRVWIVPGKGKQILGFLYVPEGKSKRDGIPILAQDMMHVKLPNPGDPLDGMGYGLPPISPMARSADVDNEITRFLKLFFERGTMQSGMVSFDEPLQPEDLDEVRDMWQEVYGGVDNWADIMVLGRGGKYTRVGLSFDEMGFQGLDERNESRILGPFGVPPILIGSRIGLERATYANYQEARKACWEDTLIPESRLFEVEYQYYLNTDKGEFVAFDTSEVPALRRDIEGLADAAFKLFSMGVPAQTALDTVGLKIEQIPGGEVGYLPMNLLPAGERLAKPQTQEQGASAVEEGQKRRKKSYPAPHRGLPGVWGGSRPREEAGGEGIDETISDEIAKCLEHGHQTGKERAVVIYRDGTMKAANGDESSVSLEGMITGEEETIIHNHPSSASFGGKDVAMFMDSDAIHDIVIGHDGTIYYASKRPDIEYPDIDLSGQRDIYEHWLFIRHQYMDDFRPRVVSGELSKDVAWREHSHVTMDQLAHELQLDYQRIEP